MGWGFEMPELLRESLWAIEGIAIFFASSLYVVSQERLKNPTVQSFLMLNALVLVAMKVFDASLMVVAFGLMISLSYNLAFLRFRDDLVIAAGDDTHKIQGYSALASFYRAVLCTISPLLLPWAFSRFNFLSVSMILVFFQFGLVLVTRSFQLKELNKEVSV